MKSILEFFVALFNWIFQVEPGRIKIGEHCYMPLFYRAQSGAVAMTWDYLSKPEYERAHLRETIKAGARSGETPAICFCLTPQNINAGVILDNMTVTDEMLEYLENRCRELVSEGIAVFLCLYVDDSAPRWMEIEKHREVWKRVHKRIGKYVSGYILSIETNEYANSVTHIDGRLKVMRDAMPGADYYGTHLQWKANNGRYSWNSSIGLPASANLILVEFSFDPHKGDMVGVQAVKNECYDIQRCNPVLRWVAHEINTNVGSVTCEAQREFLRQQNIWGVG